MQIPDVQADPEYDFPEAQKLSGFRTVSRMLELWQRTPIQAATARRVARCWSAVRSRLRDAQADPEYDSRSTETANQTVLAIPLLRYGLPLGVVAVETAIAPFTDRRIELVTTFADQPSSPSRCSIVR